VTGYEICVLALMVGGLGPALALASRGRAIDRLVGLQLAGSVVTLLFLILAQAAGQTSFLIVPLVFVPLSVAGMLVFTRLLGRGDPR
jgi:multicomponent Na+:H+ antiporter subunit F